MNRTENNDFFQKALRVANHQGLHARVATMIVQALQHYTCRVTIVKDGVEVDARSVLGLLLLAATHGSEILVSAQGPDCVQAIEQVSRLIEHDNNGPLGSKANT
jgi:phosphocarrier protein HPr